MSDEWFKTWFESKWYQELYSHRTIDEAKTAIGLVHRHINLEKGANVLDLCCGSGRHAAALAEDGFSVTGIDNSAFLIAEAQKDYGHYDNLVFFRSDMRDCYPNAPFDAVVNFFTSFGYFDEHCENESVLSNIYISLANGGYFLIDFFNAEYIKRHLVPYSRDIFDNTEIISKRRIENHQVIKDIQIRTEQGELFSYYEKVHLYTKDELQDMLIKQNFLIETCAGDYEGNVFSLENSPRCIIVCRKQ